MTDARIVLGDLEIALAVLRTSHLLVQGASGSGKSHTGRVLAEQTVEHIPIGKGEIAANKEALFL